MKTGVHVVQERVAKFHGSQCGFCTPGIVMALYVWGGFECNEFAHPPQAANKNIQTCAN